MSDFVIISGHSHGLGAALTAAWLACDARVLGLSRCTNQELATAYPHLLKEISVDLSNPMAVLALIHDMPFRRFCNEAERLWLFNNAGTVAPSTPLGTQDSDKITLAVNLNIMAPMLLSNAVVEEARRPQQVNIVHISSGAGRKAYAGWSIYGASKAALDRHAASVASEKQGVRIVSLAPGIVDTTMQENMRHDQTFPLREHFANLHLEGKLQSAEDTALKILAYCLSDQFGSDPIVDIRKIEIPL
ncbi:MAG: SDR family NAD(P)-dependent oxidoreductase [Cardiobacteriaceae bacterium]|nr:SDR family NAD(P)-dependent oxidoreductase [Cardiobacteriaceae bacterium]